MKFHEFGEQGSPVMMLLHGMLTPWQIWENAAAYFSKEYYVVVPELDGHTEEEGSTFLSVEREAELLREYALEHFEGSLQVLCGLSMGARIAASLANMPDVSVSVLVLDGAPLVKLPGILKTIMKKNYSKLIQKSRRRDPKVMESCSRDFLPQPLTAHYLKLADHMDEASISNVIDSVFSPFSYQTYDKSMRILFMHGTKGNETLARRAAHKMKELNPQTEIRCFEGYAHAQLACFENEKWVREVVSFLVQNG